MSIFRSGVEIERFFGTSIGRLQDHHLASHDFRRMAAQALKHVLSRDDGRNCVTALPPSGLLGSCGKAIKDTRDAIVIVLRDAPENILDRITFYDIDSHPVQRNLTAREKRLHLRETERDIAYFSRSFTKARVSVDITGCNPDEALHKVRDVLAPARLDSRSEVPAPALQARCSSPVCVVES